MSKLIRVVSGMVRSAEEKSSFVKAGKLLGVDMDILVRDEKEIDIQVKRMMGKTPCFYVHRIKAASITNAPNPVSALKFHIECAVSHMELRARK
jgi:hypothetical protein